MKPKVHIEQVAANYYCLYVGDHDECYAFNKRILEDMKRDEYKQQK